MAKQLRVTYFPESVIQLHKEVAKHPLLLARLASYGSKPGDDMIRKIGEIAAYCGILLDDMYDEDSLDGLCKLLVEELRKRSTAILV